MSAERSRPWQDPTPLPGFEPVWLGQFDTFEDWVSHATRALAYLEGSLGEKISAICVDTLGRRCHIGADFSRARDEGAFPIRYFLEGRIAESPEAGDEPVAEVVWYDPAAHFGEKRPHKIIDASVAFMGSAEIGARLYARPSPALSVPLGLGRSALASRLLLAFPDLTQDQAEAAAETAFPECLAVAEPTR